MTTQSSRRDVPDASVARLPAYRRALSHLAEQEVTRVSSQELAESAGVHPAQLRKDLSYLGSYGVRGVGYDVGQLTQQISAELGLLSEWPVAIVGMGHLGRALVAYRGFSNAGFRIVAVVDDDPAIVGEQIGGLSVQTLADLVASAMPLDFGVIATPVAPAQTVADVLVDLGAHSILNFAPTHLHVPAGVGVRQVDWSTELEILAFHAQRRPSATATTPGGGR